MECVKDEFINDYNNLMSENEMLYKYKICHQTFNKMVKYLNLKRNKSTKFNRLLGITEIPIEKQVKPVKQDKQNSQTKNIITSDPKEKPVDVIHLNNVDVNDDIDAILSNALKSSEKVKSHLKTKKRITK
jgi:hypothetical protein